MKKKTEQKLIQAFDQLAPDCFDSITEKISERSGDAADIADTLQPEKSKDTVYGSSAPERIHRPSRRRKFAVSLGALAAVLMLIIIPVSLSDKGAAAGHIFIDVNPGIMISLDENSKVSDISPSNKDGQDIVDDLPDEEMPSDISSSVDIIMKTLRSNGYLSDDSVDMLVSYSYSNDESKADIEANTRMIKSSVESGLKDAGTDAGWIFQEFPEEEKISETVSEEDMSPGKSRFISTLQSEYDIKKSDAEKKKISDICDSLEKSGIDISSNSRFTVTSSKAAGGVSTKNDSRSQENKSDESNTESSSSGKKAAKRKKASGYSRKQPLADSHQENTVTDSAAETSAQNTQQQTQKPPEKTVRISDISYSGKGTILIRFTGPVVYDRNMTVTVRNENNDRVTTGGIKRSQRSAAVKAEIPETGSRYKVTVRGVRASEQGRYLTLHGTFDY